MLRSKFIQMNNMKVIGQQRNRSEVLSKLRPGRLTFRNDLVRETSLSQATVFRITRQLVEEKVIKQSQRRRGSVGRPSPALEINERYASVLGLSLSMTSTRALLMDLCGGVYQEVSLPLEWHAGPDGILDPLRKVVETILDGDSIEASKLAGVGLAIPGHLNRQQGISISYTRVPDWQNVPIHELLERWTGAEVSMIGYAPALALAEQMEQSDPEPDGLLCVEVEENIAMGSIVHGKVLEGANGNAGELAHITVDPAGPICYCGNAGCLEMAATCQTVIDEAVRSELLPGNDEVTYERVVELARDGNAFAARLLGRVAGTLGIGVATAINLFNPDVLVLKGTFFRAKGLVMDPLLNTLKERALPTMTERLRVEQSKLGENAAARGAGRLAIERVLLNVGRNGA